MNQKPKRIKSGGHQSVLLALILAIPLLGHAGWQLTWSDEFTQADGTSPDPTKWGFDVGTGSGGWGNNQQEYDTGRTNNARIQGGQLVIEAKQENFGGKNYTSARMLTKGKWSWTYGRFEARIKIPRGQGIWPAFWMLGTNIDGAGGVGWPKCGEIDIMENIGKTNNNEQGKIYGTIHGPQGSGDYNGGAGVGGSYTLPGGAAYADDFHIYAAEWTTNQIKWYMDSVQYFTATPANLPGGGTWPFTNSQFVLLNLAVGGNWPGYPSNYTIFPQQMLVDYVRIYSYVATVPSMPTGFTASPGSAKVYLNWDASTSGAAGYLVKRATNSGGPYTTVASLGANNYTDTGVENCSTYYYVVAATNSLGGSTNSSEQVASLGAYALAVKSGGSAAGQFVADTGVVSGGTIGAISTAKIDTSGLVAPAPQEVYQSERYGNFIYTFTGLISGVSYKVRLHFAETHWTAVGQRRFNVTINATQVLTNFDIIAVAGSTNKATIQEFNAVASAGQIVIQYTTITDNARSGGIEILLPQPGSPAGLTAVASNSQVALKWNALPGASYNLKRALTAGGPYNPLASGLSTTNYTDAAVTNGVSYFYTVSAAILGCEGTNSVEVNATPACSPPPTPTAGNNSPLWAGMTLNLIASTVPGATYSWTGPNGFNSTNQNPAVLNATTNLSGVFSVTATANGCTSDLATTTVTVNPLANVAIQYVDGNVILEWLSGTLQSATNISGPWGDIGEATSPRTNPVAASQEFYRLRLQ
jgi:beta-glucanase (GH16 family)